MLNSLTYRLTGDFIHVGAYLFLFLVLIWKKNVRGISGKTQLLYAITYTLRYSDLWFFWTWISTLNTALKIYFIIMSYLVTYLIYSSFRETYNREHDSLNLEYILLPTLILALFCNHSTDFQEILWTCSIYLEAVCLLPQFYMIYKASGYGPQMSVICFTLLVGIYRAMYIVNWVYRYQEEKYYDSIAFYSGIVEVVIALVGLLCIVSLKIRLWSCDSYSSQPTTIYTLPQVQESFRKNYKPLVDSKNEEKNPILVNSNFLGQHTTGNSYTDRTSQNSYYVI